MRIDAFGKQCPLPVMMAKKEMDKGSGDFDIAVDNDTAVKNLTKLGERAGFSVSVQTIEGGHLVSLSRNGGSNPDAGGGSNPDVGGGSSPDAGGGEELRAVSSQSRENGQKSGYAVFIGKDHVGEGDGELGYNLMKMALFTLSESDEIPSSLLFMNSGVKLLAQGDRQIAEHVGSMMERGTEVLVCGTCLDFYGLKANLQAGEVSNMYDILGRMHDSAKVITL